MFATSTQKRCWLFDSQQVIDDIRRRTNEQFIADASPVDPEPSAQDGGAGDAPMAGSPEQPGTSALSTFLSPEEEVDICKIVLEGARKFCQDFKPPMPGAVTWTAVTYFKRFFLRKSVMQFVPKRVMLGCMYLACKVEEFNVSIDDFIDNLKSGSRDDNLDTILSNELETMFQLDYQLAVHSPYRPLEGLIIDIKTRSPEVASKVDGLRQDCESFLFKALMSDTMLLFPPSQIALAALMHSSSSHDVPLDTYCRNCVATTDEQYDKLINRLHAISEQVNAYEPVPMSRVDEVMAKLKECVRQSLDRTEKQGKKRKAESMEDLLAEDEPDFKKTAPVT